MSEPKLISPLLDGFVMGDPISDRHGVKSCPAMQTDTEDKYIVKIISVPADQSKLDALLLAGAFADKASALSYFADLADGIEQEAITLQRLSQLEGFEAFQNWQTVPMDDEEVGYDVYLIGSYRAALDRLLRRGSMTHLAAVNLGLDLCAALSACRRSGYLYVNLKPENIYIGGDNEYRIGDLGFLPLSSLAFASLPERYLSSYTAPEIADAYSALNDTVDVYSVGLILYQAFNGGVLPFEDRAPETPLSAPQYADVKMAEIILKACDPNPEVRWQSPQQMGQALASYLQSNVVNDTLIVQPPQSNLPEELQDEPIPEETDDTPSTDEILAEVDEALIAAGIPEEALTAEPPTEEAPEEEAHEEEAPVPKVEEINEISEEAAEAVEEAVEEAEEIVTSVEAEEEVEAEPEAIAEAVEAEDAEEADPAEEDLGVTKETSEMLAQADDLIAHELPEGVVVPEPIDVPIPDPVEEASEALSEDAEEAPEELPAEETICEYDETEDASLQAPSKKRRGLLVALLCVVLAAALAFGAYFYYQNVYLQTILGITLNGAEDELTVTLNTEADSNLLLVSCIDTYGNKHTAPVTDGRAYFTDLNPDTTYKIQVEIRGFHKLIGKTTHTYETAKETSIIGLSAVTGTEEGSLILSFAVQGPEAGGWKIVYSAAGEAEQSVSFTGHMVTLTGLTVGKEYTFQLQPQEALYVVGTDSLTHVVRRPIYAEDLEILGFRNNALSFTWRAPEGETVEQWTVRCYNSNGYDKTLTTDEPKISFPDLDVTSAYTVEVTAVGMTQGTRAYISENSLTLSSLEVDSADRNQLTVSWTCESAAPEGGWLLIYTIDGDAENKFVLQCNDATSMTIPKLPGCKYEFSVQSASGSTVFGGTCAYEAPAAEPFSGYSVSNENMSFTMCQTPENPQWTHYDIRNYTTRFTIGQSASFAVWLDRQYNTSDDMITTLFVIRNQDGKLISNNSYTMSWTSMWYRGFSRVNIPAIPNTAGEYTVSIYFNGAFVTTQNFTVV